MGEVSFYVRLECTSQGREYNAHTVVSRGLINGFVRLCVVVPGCATVSWENV